MYKSKIKPFILLIFVGLFFIALVDYLSYHFGEDVNWDLLNYHLYNGYAFLHHRLINDSLQTVQSYLDPFLNSFYYILFVNFSPLIVNLAIASLQSLGIIFIFLLSFYVLKNVKNLYFRIIISFIIALSSVFGPVFLSEIGGTMGDTLLASFVILGIIFVTKTLDSITNQNEPKLSKKIILYLSSGGVSVGIASGLKFTNMVYMLGIFFSFCLILFFIRNLSLKLKLIATLILGFSIMFAFVAIYAPIGFMLYEYFKNPIYPYYNNIFKSPYIQPIEIKDMRWIPENTIQYLSIPFLLASPSLRTIIWPSIDGHKFGLEIPFKIYLFAVIFIIFPFYLVKIVKNHKDKNFSYSEIFLVSFFIISFNIWALEFAYYRYAAVLELIAPVILYIMLSYLFNNSSNYKLNMLFSVITLIISVMSLPASNWGRIKPFPNNYFGLKRQIFDKYKNSLIIVGSAPEGFILTYFPKDIKVMAIPLRLPVTEYFKEKYFQTLEHWNKRIYYLTIGLPSIKKTLHLLKYHSLFLNYNTCRPIHTYVETLYLCELQKTSLNNVKSLESDLINQYYMYYNKIFSRLLYASRRFIIDGQNPSHLYPKYLEEHGYLDKGFGYYSGKAKNWTQNGGWIGKWPCPDGKGECFGIGIIGDIDSLKPIIDEYKSQALQIFFPCPKIYKENSKEKSGQLLMIFRAPTPKPATNKDKE